MKSETDYISVKTNEKSVDIDETDGKFEKTKLLNIVLLGIVFMTTGSRYVVLVLITKVVKDFLLKDSNLNPEDCVVQRKAAQRHQLCRGFPGRRLHVQLSPLRLLCVV